MGVFHQESTLRFHSAEIHLCYDGSIRLSTNAEVLAPDGTSAEIRHGYTHRISPHHPHWRFLAEALRPAVKAHHEALGLDCPDEALPMHLHPQGHPAFDLPPLDEPPLLDQDELRARLAREKGKDREQGTTVSARARPGQEGTASAHERT